MGGDGRSRKRRASPSSSPSPNGGAASSSLPAEAAEERERRRSSSSTKSGSHRAGDGEKPSRKEGRKSRREDDKDQKSRKDSDKSRKRSREEDREEKKRRKKKKSREKEKRRISGGKASDSFEELSKDDYFSKNNEFSTWLKEEKGMFFSELSSETAREWFSSFVEEWNSRKLLPRYYEGIASGPRTGHDWKIKT